MSMSWIRSASWPVAVALVLALTSGARAENVDWSQYVEKPAPTHGAATSARSRSKPAARPAKPVASKGKVKHPVKRKTPGK